MLMAVIKTEDGATVAIIPLAPKDFKTGSHGFFGQGKVETGGERLQVQVQAVVIGSKGETKAEG